MYTWCNLIDVGCLLKIYKIKGNMPVNFNLDVSDAIYKCKIYSILYFYELIFLHTKR